MFQKEYFRLFLTVGVIGVAVFAHRVTIMELGYEKMSPVYSSDQSLSVTSAGEAGVMSVSYSNPGTLGVGISEGGGEQQAAAGQSAVQESVSLGATSSPVNVSQGVVNGQNGIPTTATTRVDVPEADLKMYMQKVKTQVNTSVTLPSSL